MGFGNMKKDKLVMVRHWHTWCARPILVLTLRKRVKYACFGNERSEIPETRSSNSLEEFREFRSAHSRNSYALRKVS